MISTMDNIANEFKFIVKNDAYGFRFFPADYFNFILDVGANIGFFSVYARMKFPKARMIAVEPCYETLLYLRQNINMLDIALVEKAFGDGSIVYFEKGERGKHEILGHKFISDKDMNQDIQTYPIESVTLKELCIGLKQPYALKFNCEGAEKVLLNDKDSLGILRDADFVGIMCHFQNEKNKSYSQGWLQEEDYDNFFFGNFKDRTVIKHHVSRRGSCMYSVYKEHMFALAISSDKVKR